MNLELSDEAGKHQQVQEIKNSFFVQMDHIRYHVLITSLHEALKTSSQLVHLWLHVLTNPLLVKDCKTGR